MSQSPIAELEEGTSIQGYVRHGEYRYFKYTFSYNDTSTQSPSSNPSAIVSSNTRSRRVGKNRSSWTTSDQSFTSSSKTTTSSDLLSVRDPFDPQDPQKNSITIELHATSGDSDLYVSCILEESSGVYLTPSKIPGHYNFSSHHYNDDILSISAGDTRNCARHGKSGTFYIAVFGSSYGTSEFVVTLNMFGGVRTLVNGLTIYGTVLAGLGTLFRYQLPDKNAVPILLSMDITSGDADLYVKLGVAKAHDENHASRLPYSESAGASSDGSPYDPARKDHYDYKSAQGSVSHEYIRIEESDMAACAAATCWVSILVAGYSASSYSLRLIAGDSIVLLSNAQPQHSSVAKVKRTSDRAHNTASFSHVISSHIALILTRWYILEKCLCHSVHSAAIYVLDA